MDLYTVHLQTGHLGYKHVLNYLYQSVQVRQRADDVRKSLDLLQLLNDGAEIRNMMEGYFDFRQLQVATSLKN